MADHLSKAARSELMSRIGPKDTIPEVRVRKVAHALGLRFRLHHKGLPGKPDLVLRKHRLAIFVHGCFWHRHEGCRNCTSPKTRHEFWKEKFRKNVERDLRVQEELMGLGWRVAVFWECETDDRAYVEEQQL